MTSRAGERAGAQWSRSGAVVLALAFGAALLLLRQRGVGAFDTLWAEDGSIFLQEALEDASPRGWLRSYAGYMHLAPRVLASLATSLPIDWAPTVFSSCAALTTAAVALISYRASEAHIPSRAYRGVLALALLLLPAAGLETANAVANIHWYLIYGIVWVSLWRPTRSGDTFVGSAYLFVTAASDPFAVLAAPVLGWRLLRAPRRVDWIFAGALGAGILLQAGVILGSAGSRPLDPFGTSLTDLGRWYGFHVLEGAVLGVALRDALNDALGVAPGAVFALLVLAVLLAPAVRAARVPSLVPMALSGLHLGLYFFPVVLAAVATSRYSVTPIMLLYALIAWGLASEVSARRRVASLAVALLALIIAIDFAPWNSRAEGPRWSEGLSDARTRCGSARDGVVDILIPPRSDASDTVADEDTHRWSVRVPCRTLQATK